MNDYDRLRKIGIRMPEMLDVDIENERILKDYIKGDTIFDYVLRNEVKPTFVEQMKEMCVYLYAANTNIDYFPTNFVVNQGKVWYVDFECNDYQQQWDYEHWGKQYWWKSPSFCDYFGI